MSIDRSGTLAFVPPRYGPGVVGGAEVVFSEFAHGLAGLGWDVEVLTTCARDHYTWANEFAPGTTQDGPIRVRRFPTVLDTPGRDRDRLGNRLLAGERLTLEEQQRWVNDSLRVPDLWFHLLDHGADYRAIFFGPYMFWTTFACGQVHPDRTILIPCLHDEPAAHLDLYKPMVEGARGIVFLSDPERDLAQQIFRVPGNHEVIGSLIDLPDTYDVDTFRREHGIDGRFVYYAGRREWAKGWIDLVEAFRIVRERGSSLRLVTSGAGDPHLGTHDLGGALIDLGFVDEATRDAAMAAADCYVQPSALESFSRTILEAWGAGTPVIANAESEVVAWHVERSGGGVLYRGGAELVEALTVLDENPKAIVRLAEDARAYVVDEYAPISVLDRLDDAIRRWTP